MIGIERPPRVALFVTCLVDLLYPEVGEATVALLEREGVTVEVPDAQTCCGQPPFNSGFHDDARRLARTMLDAFEGAEAVVTPSGSCAAMVRSYYPHLFDGLPEYPRTVALAAKTFELSEFMVDVLGVLDVPGAWRGRVTYHDSCHGLRELGLRGQGRRLVESIDGVELVEMARPDMCCGFGGTFSVRLPDLATAMADDKIDQTEATGAAIVLTGDTGCLMHVAGRMSRRGSTVRPMHLATFLAAAAGIGPRPPS